MTLGTLASVTGTYPSPPVGRVPHSKTQSMITLNESTLQKFYETEFHKSRASARVVAAMLAVALGSDERFTWSADLRQASGR
jgi:hypothetical protein